MVEATAQDAVETQVRAGVQVVDETRVPFWIVLTGVGVGAVWALTGVVVGYRIARR